MARPAVREGDGRQRLARATAGLPAGEAARALLGTGAPWYESWLEHPEYDDPFWSYSPGLADYAIGKMRQDFVNNGSDGTLGNFEVDRIQRLIDIVTPILVGQRKPPKPGLRPQDLYTNEFIDPSIGVVAS